MEKQKKIIGNYEIYFDDNIEQQEKLRKKPLILLIINFILVGITMFIITKLNNQIYVIIICIPLVICILKIIIYINKPFESDFIKINKLLLTDKIIDIKIGGYEPKVNTKVVEFIYKNEKNEVHIIKYPYVFKPDKTDIERVNLNICRDAVHITNPYYVSTNNKTN